MGSGPGSHLHRVLVMDTGTGHATTCRSSCMADLLYSTFMYSVDIVLPGVINFHLCIYA